MERRVALILSLFIVNSFSSEINNSLVNEENVELKSEKKLFQIEYEKALSFYKKRDYEKSYELFSKLFINNMDNLLVNFYLGRSAYETKRYEFAISAYDRILIKDPKNVRTRVELAQTYLQMNLFTQSIKEFEIALKEKLPLSVRKRVLGSLNFLKSTQKRHYFNATGLLSFIYDSNVNATADAGSFDIYSPAIDSITTLDNNEEKKSASILQLAAVLSYKYKFDDNFIIENTLTPLIQKYNNFKEKDIHALSLNIAPSYYSKNYKMQLSFLYDHIYLGHEKNQGNYYINPKYTYILTSDSLIEFGVKKGRINYFVEDERDADLNEIETSYRLLTEKFGIFTLGLGYGKEKERIDTRTDVSNSYYSLSLSNSLNLFEKYSLQTQFSYRDKKYKDEDVNFQNQREDKKRDYSLTLQRSFSDNFVMSIGGTYTDNSSNHEPFSYDKYTLKTNFIYSF